QRGTHHHRVVAPRPLPLGSRIRDARRHKPNRRLIRPDNPSPPESRRRPSAQPSAPHNRALTTRNTRPNTGLHRSPHQRGQERPRNQPLPQALPRPPPLPTAGGINN